MADRSASESIARSAQAPRLVAVDFFRGLALVCVLLNHLDWSAGPRFLRRLTPIGLGFSDGAEAFVFLSGLTFGWVYSARLQQDGFKRSFRKILSRSLQIYAAYVITLLLIAALSVTPVEMTDWTRHALRIGPGESFGQALFRMVRMEAFPFGSDILGLYIVLLPCMLLLLAAARHARWAVLAASAIAYVAVQPPLRWSAASPTWLGGWYFHPLAWQFLFVLGMLIGESRRRTREPLPRSCIAATLAAAIVLIGLLRGLRYEIEGLTESSQRALWQWIDVSHSWLAAKPRLGPVRLVHFSAVACLAAYVLPSARRFWQSPWIRPVVNTGRHSLTIYCFGTLLVYAAAIPLDWFGNSPAVVTVLATDACLLQFALAGWLERRQPTGDALANPQASRTGGLTPAPDAAGTT